MLNNFQFKTFNFFHFATSSTPATYIRTRTSWAAIPESNNFLNYGIIKKLFYVISAAEYAYAIVKSVKKKRMTYGFKMFLLLSKRI